MLIETFKTLHYVGGISHFLPCLNGRGGAYSILLGKVAKSLIRAGVLIWMNTVIDFLIYLFDI